MGCGPLTALQQPLDVLGWHKLRQGGPAPVRHGRHTSGQINDGVQGNIVGASPRLEPLSDNGGPTLTHQLLVGSPAIDAGTNALSVSPDGWPLAFDQRGPAHDRLVGQFVDMGAIEFTDGAGGSIAGRKLIGQAVARGEALKVRIYIDRDDNGRLDAGEDSVDVALREMQEEV